LRRYSNLPSGKTDKRSTATGGLPAYLRKHSNLILSWTEMQTLAWTLTPDTFTQLLWPIGKTWSLEAIVRVFQKEYIFEWIKIGGTMQRNHLVRIDALCCQGGSAFMRSPLPFRGCPP
jgi:hypothetical protein